MNNEDTNSGYRSTQTTAESGSPYDNAIAERINGILKQEFGLDKIFKTYREAVEPVAKAIYTYNHIRPHFCCTLKTPVEKHYLELQSVCQPKSVLKQ